ncbi:HNH endonuclease [Natrinema salinisoli]|uniref:HNH endonuclease n=1 Tax=Natrinema salinisoli TaxID=2878535 RepID=UPI001CF08B55|nr:HNH endonuclease [Natrinema salinisoli]
MRHPEPGKTFLGVIGRISNNGNGMIADHEINIGPASNADVGKAVEVDRESGEYTIREEIPEDTAKELLKRHVDRKTPSSFNPLRSQGDLQGEAITVVPKETLYEDGLYYENTGVPVANAEGRTIFAIGANVGEEVKIEVESSSPLYAIGEVVSAAVDVESDTGSADSDEESSASTLNTLREKAEEDAVDEVPEDAEVNRSSTEQYTRSLWVKRYVKERAGGRCEGCGEPAPFTSKTGEPYLHAHHVHELSNGGSDTPDTVIALCPNCHYRIHHGDDGDEYNEDLLEIVQEIEGDD